MTHRHNHCEHDLKYCDHCDVVYCTKCDREWGGHTHYYVQPYTWYYYGIPYTVRYTTNVGYSLTASDGQSVSQDTLVWKAFTNNNKDVVDSNTVCTHHQ